MRIPRAFLLALAGTLLLVLAGCFSGDGDGAADRSDPPSPTASDEPTPSRSSSAEPTPDTSRARKEPASLTIPAIDVRNLKVVPYKGTTDDWPGTRIQNRGVAASPYGSDGGVGPGEAGNYLVTAHRLSAGGPLRELPSLDRGDVVEVTSGGITYTYKITESRQTSFRSEKSLKEQRAAVPGSPGKRPAKPMITVSTCATPEDDAAGNSWRDDKDNPEHRIDKVGVLTSIRKAPTGSASP